MVLDLYGLGGGPPRRGPRLHVIPMALALIFAAFLGAAVGLVWQSSGLDDEAPASDSGEGGGGAGSG